MSRRHRARSVSPTTRRNGWRVVPSARVRGTCTSHSSLTSSRCSRTRTSRRSPPRDVRHWRGRLSRSGLHRNTVAKVYRLFRSIISTAVDDGLVRASPVAIKGAATEQIAERPLLAWSDVERLAASIEQCFSALVWTAAVGGLRFGELTALDRRRLDVDAGTIRVDRALTFIKGSGPTFGPPKSLAAHRVVAIPPVLCATLMHHLDHFVEPGAEAVVFTSIKCSLLLNRYFAPYWQTAKRAADGTSP